MGMEGESWKGETVWGTVGYGIIENLRLRKRGALRDYAKMKAFLVKIMNDGESLFGDRADDFCKSISRKLRTGDVNRYAESQIRAFVEGYVSFMCSSGGSPVHQVCEELNAQEGCIAQEASGGLINLVVTLDRFVSEVESFEETDDEGSVEVEHDEDEERATVQDIRALTRDGALEE